MFLHRFLKQKEDTKTVTINLKRDLQLQYELLESSDNVPSELLACRLPAWYLPNQRTCIAGSFIFIHDGHFFNSLSGLCSVIRYAFRMGYICENLDICYSLLGFQQVWWWILFYVLWLSSSLVLELSVSTSRSFHLDKVLWSWYSESIR